MQSLLGLADYMIAPAQFLLPSPYNFICSPICNQSLRIRLQAAGGDGNIHGIKGGGQAAVILVRHMDKKQSLNPAAMVLDRLDR